MNHRGRGLCKHSLGQDTQTHTRTHARAHIDKRANEGVRKQEHLFIDIHKLTADRGRGRERKRMKEKGR